MEKRRICLKCNTEFKSKGFANRLCARCNTNNMGQKPVVFNDPDIYSSPLTQGSRVVRKEINEV